jgi:hypothetical protein
MCNRIVQKAVEVKPGGRILVLIDESSGTLNTNLLTDIEQRLTNEFLRAVGGNARSVFEKNGGLVWTVAIAQCRSTNSAMIVGITEIVVSTNGAGHVTRECVTFDQTNDAKLCVVGIRLPGFVEAADSHLIGKKVRDVAPKFAADLIRTLISETSHELSRVKPGQLPPVGEIVDVSIVNGTPSEVTPPKPIQ